MRSPAAIAAALTVPATLCLVAAACGRTAAAQPARGAAADWDYGQLAEGYTSASVGGGVDAAYRMFSTPDFPRVCVDARAGDVTSLRAAPPSIDARVGVPIPYARLKVDAVDRHGVLVPNVPIAIESYMWSDALDTRNDHIGEDSVTPKKAGTIRLRIRTICDAPGGETFVTIRVAP